MVAMLVTTAQAATVYTEDFAVAPASYVDVAEAGQTYPDGDVYVPGNMGVDTWGIHGNKVAFPAAQQAMNVIMKANKDETASAGIVLDASRFTGGAGTYTVSYEIPVLNANLQAEAYVWEVDGGTSGSDEYYLDLTTLSAAGNEPGLNIAGASTATFSKCAGHIGALGVNTLTFSYSGGTKDVVLFFATRNTAAKSWDRIIRYDNIQVSFEPPVTPTDKPNVIMIMMDDMGWSDIAAYRRYQNDVMGDDMSTPYGIAPIPTPNMDRVCAEGMMFIDAHSPAGLCAPTRFSMMTGSNPVRNGRDHGTWDWTASSAFEAGGQHHVTVGEVAQAGGYRTAVFGKMHFGGGDDNLEEPMPVFPSKFGFDYSFCVPNGIQQWPYCYFEDDRFVKINPADPLNPSEPGFFSDIVDWYSGEYAYGDLPGTIVGINGSSVIQAGSQFEGIGDRNWDVAQNPMVNTNKVVGFIDDCVTNSPDQPFLIHYNVPQPHAPQCAPIDYVPNVDGSPHDPPIAPCRDTTVGNHHSDVIYTIDHIVGQILDKLEDPDGDGDDSDSILADTLLYVTSDNGGLPNNGNKLFENTPEWYDSSGPAAGFKGSPNEGGHRVPFVAMWPDKIAAGSVSDQLVIGHDWVATMYALCGLTMAPGQCMDAANLLPILLGTDPDTPIRPFAHHQGHTGEESAGWQPNPWVMRQDIDGGQYTLIMDRTGDRNPVELYNLATDFGQTTNLINDPAYADIVDQMHTLYLAYNGQNGPRTTPAYIAPSTDTDPPTPNPATFALAPEALSGTEITMSATTGSDASGMVWYKFEETSGNAGGDNSNWQLSPEYTDTGLLPGTGYTYTVTMADGLLNEGIASAPATARTRGLPVTGWVGTSKVSGHEIPGLLETDGTPIRASNLGGGDVVTVGGVTFDNDYSNLTGWGGVATKGYYPGTDPDLQTLLNTQGMKWAYPAPKINFTGLVSGRQYRMQMIVGCAWSWDLGPMSLRGPNGETILLGADEQPDTEGIYVGTLVFVAPSSDITFEAVSAWGKTLHVMAYSLYSTDQWVTYENLHPDDVRDYWLDQSGTPVRASNLGLNAVPVTVAGINFDNDHTGVTGYNAKQAVAGYYTGTDPNLQELLQTQVMETGGGFTDINLTGLTPGVSYRMQMMVGQKEGWVTSEVRLFAPDGTMAILATPGSPDTLHVATWAFEPELDGTALFRVRNKPDWGHAHLMAFSLRSTQTPGVFNPTPADGAKAIDPTAEMSWEAFNVISPTFDINIGTTPDCDDLVGGVSTGSAQTFDPAGLIPYGTKLYWRVDMTMLGEEYIGTVWSFKTGGTATNPLPESGLAIAKQPSTALRWSSDDWISGYAVYFGTPGDLLYVGKYTGTSVLLTDLEALGLGHGQNKLPKGDYQWRVDTLDASDNVLVTGDVWDVTIIDVPTGKKKKPNILYILTDDQGYSDVGAQGWPGLEFETPNADRIFNSGVRFTQAYVSNSVCAPSRAGLITGRMGSRFGFEGNFVEATADRENLGLDPGQETIADVLKRVNYKTFALGKWHLGEGAQFHPNARGFDEWFGFLGGARSYFQLAEFNEYTSLQDNDVFIDEPAGLYTTDLLTRKGLEYITEQSIAYPKQPWFMYLCYNAPHDPMHAKEADMDRVPLANHFAGGTSKYWLIDDDGNVTQYSGDNNQLRQVYGAMVVNMDDNIGRLLNYLDLLGITDNTMVVFHSDNGGPLWGGGKNWSINTPLRGQKGELFEGGVRVPFAISFPGTIPAGQVIGEENYISSLDLMPTFAAVSEANKNSKKIRTDGVNLMPLLTGETATLPARDLLWRRGQMTNTGIRSGEYKYLYKRSVSQEWLFDNYVNCETNPCSVLGDSPEIADELYTRYLDWEYWMPDQAWTGQGPRLAITTYDLDLAVREQAYYMQLTYNVPVGTTAPVTWSMFGAPAWLSLDPVTGELTGTPSADAVKDNVLSLQIECDGETSGYNVPLTVVDASDLVD